MNKFKGVFTALLTPYNEDNTINYNSIKEIIEYNLKNGINGFYVCGSTGEGLLLTIEERKSIYEYVAKVVNKRATLIAHVGTISTRDAIEMAKKAESVGFDAISAVAPYYYGFSYDAIKKYYNDIAESVEIPMVIYNFPNSGGFTFTPSIANDFFKSKRFIGIKHTSTDLFALERFKHLDREIVVFNGFDEMLIAGLSMGADGGIGSTYNFMPNIIVAIYNYFNEGNIKKAMMVQEVANNIISKLIKYGVMACEKEILTQMGIPMGKCREPFLPLTEEAKEEMKKIVKEVKEFNL